MTNTAILPQYKTIYYGYDPETGYYTKTLKNAQETPCMRLPYKLKIEAAILHQIKCNASQIIRGNEKYKSGSFKFFTGLQVTNFKGWFSGNDYEILKTGKTLSLCLFQINSERTAITVYYFGRFYKENRAERDRFISYIIPYLQKSI